MMQALATLVSLFADRKDDEGATAVEYGLIVALIAAAVIAVVGFLGADVLEAFNVIEDRLYGNDG